MPWTRRRISRDGNFEALFQEVAQVRFHTDIGQHPTKHDPIDPALAQLQDEVVGPQTNDLVLQLRKRRIDRIVLGGMLANICVESHLRDFLEQGFEVAVARDATAGPRHPEWGDGYTAALINFKFLAHALLTTDEVVTALAAGASA